MVVFYLFFLFLGIMRPLTNGLTLTPLRFCRDLGSLHVASRYDRKHPRAPPTTGIARNRTTVPSDFGRRKFNCDAAVSRIQVYTFNDASRFSSCVIELCRTLLHRVYCSWSLFYYTVD